MRQALNALLNVCPRAFVLTSMLGLELSPTTPEIIAPLRNRGRDGLCVDATR